MPSVILGPGEGSVVSVMGNDIMTRVSTHDTGGALWVMEYAVEAGFGGPPAHVHAQTHEVFYVLEGNLGLRLDGQEVMLAAGGIALVAPGTAHTFFTREG